MESVDTLIMLRYIIVFCLMTTGCTSINRQSYRQGFIDGYSSVTQEKPKTSGIYKNVSRSIREGELDNIIIDCRDNNDIPVSCIEF